MADEYIDVPLETESDDLLQNAFDTIQTAKPDWEPNEANIETLLLAAIAEMASEVVTVASSVPTAIFRYFGARLVNLPAIDATEASVTSTWTMRDNAGYTIPAGTIVSIEAAGDNLIPFQTLLEVVVPPGSAVTAAGEVVLVAVSPGADGSGLDGPVELVDALDFVSGIALVGDTTGGLDAEEDSDYLNRLSPTLETMSPRPIIPRDFAILSRTVAGVWRALALDGYNPATATFGNERMVAVALIDSAGANVSAGIKTAVDDLLQGLREVNFIVNMIDPTRTTIDVTYHVVMMEGYDAVDVEDAVDAALADYLSPANWGITNLGEGEFPEWDPDSDVVRFSEVSEVINRVAGVKYIVDAGLTLGANGGAQAAANVNLAGAAPLTQAGAFVGTVDAP